MDKFLLTNKNAIITGSSSGIGRATAELFVELGANVLITGRNEASLKAVELSCLSKKSNENQKIVTFRADLSKEDEVRKLSEKTLSEFPVLDILVNNAGAFFYDNIETFDMTRFENHFKINLKCVIQLTNLLVSALIESKGCIVNVSGDSGGHANPNLLTHCAGKAALDHFSRCIALELAPKGVRTNVIHPGIIATDIFRNCELDEQHTSEHFDNWKSKNVLGRVGDPSEIAYGIAFLVSPASSYTVGSTLSINGGRNFSW